MAAAESRRHKTVWPLVSLLLIADIVGAGILELPSNMARVGWIIGVALLALGAPLNVYTGLLLARLRNVVYPQTTSYGELAGAIFGRPVGIAVAVVVYINLAMTLGAYNLVLTRSMQALFYELDLCQPLASLLVCAVLAPFNQIQTLHGISTISAIGFVAIVVAVACCLAWAWFGDDVRWDGQSHELFPRGIGFFSAFAAMSGFTFAYAGQTIYLEILSEMKDARSFPKALFLSTPLMLVAYATVAFTGYSVAGSATPPSLMDVLPFDWRMIVANLFLIIHMVISYIITSQVLSRAFVNAVVPLLCPRLASPLGIDLNASEALLPRDGASACGRRSRGSRGSRGSSGGRGSGATPTASELTIEEFDFDGGSAEEEAAVAAEAEAAVVAEEKEARRGGASSATAVELTAILRPQGVPESEGEGEGDTGAVHLSAGGALTESVTVRVDALGDGASGDVDVNSSAAVEAAKASPAVRFAALALWFAVSTAISLIAWLTTNIVPFFDDLTGILGAIAFTPMALIFPCVGDRRTRPTGPPTCLPPRGFLLLCLSFPMRAHAPPPPPSPPSHAHFIYQMRVRSRGAPWFSPRDARAWSGAPDQAGRR